MCKELITPAVVVLFSAALAAAILPALARARSTPAINTCINNLRLLDGAKRQWELEHHRSTNEPPLAVADLRAYLEQTLLCPQGGTYNVGRVGESPKCSLGGTHALPQ